jgi:hypothetical protein
MKSIKWPAAALAFGLILSQSAFADWIIPRSFTEAGSKLDQASDETKAQLKKLHEQAKIHLDDIAKSLKSSSDTLKSHLNSITIPYKTIDLTCKAQDDILVLKWNFSKSLFVDNILLNCTSVIGGTDLSQDPANSKETTYSREGLFSIRFSAANEKDANFKTSGSVNGKDVQFYCEQVSGWHVLKSSDEKTEENSKCTNSKDAVTCD